MKKIIEYLQPLYGRMAAGFGIKLVGTVMDLAIPWILAHMIDEIVPTKDQRRILLWGVGMAVCAVIALLGNVIANRRASAVARDATRRIRHDLFDKIEHLSARQLDELGIPSLISRLTSDTYNVNQTIGRIQRLGVRAPILLTGGVIVTMLLDIRLSMVLIATLPLLALGVWLISKKGISLYAGVQQNVDKMVRTVRDDVTGIRVIRALSQGEYECEHFGKDSEELSYSQIHADSVMAATNPMMQLLLNLGLTAVVVFGAYWVNMGVTKPGSIIAFLTYFTIILNAMMSVNKMFVMLSQATASADRIERVLNLPPEEIQNGLPKIQTDAVIVFDDVCFSYKETEEETSQMQQTDQLGSKRAGKQEKSEMQCAEKKKQSGMLQISGKELYEMQQVTKKVETGRGQAAEKEEPGMQQETEKKQRETQKRAEKLQPADCYDLSHISFQLKKGQTLGVIGATGSGKTTLIQLLQRFYPVNAGAIYVNGENVAGMEEQKLHSLFGVAFQSDAFFAGIIYDNIDLGRGLPREEIEKAARCAQAEEFILEKEAGYQSEVHAKAANLSGGQKQRLLIARALAGNPSILILDDSSSALDYRTDAAMRNAVRKEYPDTTMILVAQRVSSVRNADLILVLEEGHAAGLGTHEELMEKCFLYQEISRIQTGEK